MKEGEREPAYEEDGDCWGCGTLEKSKWESWTEAGHICIEFVAAIQAADVVSEDINKLLVVKVMSINEIDQRDTRPVTDPGDKATQWINIYVVKPGSGGSLLSTQIPNFLLAAHPPIALYIYPEYSS